MSQQIKEELEAQVRALQQEALRYGDSSNPAARKLLEKAAALAIRAYGPEIRGWLARRVRQADLADDLFQEVCAGLWRGLPSFRWGSEEAPCSLRTWFYKIAFYAICHHHRASPQDQTWSTLLREAQQLAKEHPGPQATRLVSTLKALYRSVTHAHEDPSEAQSVADEVRRSLEGLLQDKSLHSLPSFTPLLSWLGEHQTKLIDAIAKPSNSEPQMLSSGLSVIAQEITSMSSRIDKQNKLLECLEQLKEQDRVLILLRQLEGSDSWKDIARALNNYRELGEGELDSEAARLRQRFHRAMEELKSIARAKGLSI